MKAVDELWNEYWSHCRVCGKVLNVSYGKCGEDWLCGVEGKDMVEVMCKNCGAEVEQLLDNLMSLEMLDIL